MGGGKIAEGADLEEFSHLEFAYMFHKVGKSGHFFTAVGGDDRLWDMVEDLIQSFDSSLIDH